MAKLGEEEKRELRELANSSQLREDTTKLTETRYNPFIINGNVDIDRLLIFLTEYNQFINHNLKPFQEIIDKDMRL